MLKDMLDRPERRRGARRTTKQAVRFSADIFAGLTSENPVAENINTNLWKHQRICRFMRTGF
jgi:hypothetical protein